MPPLAARRNAPFSKAMTMAFVFLVPGYFLYHWMALIGLMPLLLGGYSNESAAIVLMWVLLWGLCGLPHGSLGSLRLSWAEILYGIFMLYFGVMVLTHWGVSTAPQVSVSHTASIIQLLAAFAVFRLAPLQSRGLRQVLLVTVVAMSLLVYQAAATDALTLLLASSDDTRVANYQGLGRAFLLTVVPVAAFTSSRWKRLLHYINATMVIFLLGARSEVAGLLVFAATFEWMLMRRKGRTLLIMTVLLAATAALLIAILPLLGEWFPDNRVLLLMQGFESDGSVLERGEQIRFALGSIATHPVLGAYGSYGELGNAGSYAHNILSVWVDLGILGLGILLALLVSVSATYFAATHALAGRPKRDIALHAMGAGMLMQTLVFLFAAKAFTDVSIPMLVGVTGMLCARLHPLRLIRSAPRGSQLFKL